jgi:hypothetical protein
MYLFKGPDGLPSERPKLLPQTTHDEWRDFWIFVQRLSLVVGLAVGIRSLSR